MANGDFTGIPGYGVWSPDVLWGMQQGQQMQGGGLSDLLAFARERANRADELAAQEAMSQGAGLFDVGLQRATTAFDTPMDVQWAPTRSWGGQVGPTINPGLSMLLSLLGPSMAAGYGGGY